MLNRILKVMWLRTIVGVLLSILSGCLLFLSFPPYDLWYLALFALVPSLIAQFRIMSPRTSSIAPSIAIGLWMAVYLGPVFEPMGGIVVYIPLLVAVITLMTEVGQRKFSDTTRYHYFIISGVAGWVGFEMIRLMVPFIGSWGFIAYPFYRQAWLLQPLSYVGILGMSALVISINYVIALILIKWLDVISMTVEQDQVISWVMVKRWTAGVLAVTLIWVSISLVLYTMPSDQEAITVAAIQPESAPIVSANAGDNAKVEKLYDDFIRETIVAAEQGAQLVVWPEGTLNWDPQVEDSLDLAKLAIEQDIYLAVGYVVFLENGFRNEVTVINPSGEFLGVFGKDHPVVLSGETSLSRGEYPVFESEMGLLGAIICYDLDFTDTARKVSTQGAKIIAVPSNDWSGIATKHYTHVVFRAVENNLPMIKADGGYNSAIISAKGDIVEKAVIPEGGAATVVAEVTLGSGNPTLYAQTGDWIGWMFLGIMIFFALFGSMISRHRLYR